MENDTSRRYRILGLAYAVVGTTTVGLYIAFLLTAFNGWLGLTGEERFAGTVVGSVQAALGLASIVGGLGTCRDRAWGRRWLFLLGFVYALELPPLGIATLVLFFTDPRVAVGAAAGSAGIEAVSDRLEHYTRRELARETRSSPGSLALLVRSLRRQSGLGSGLVWLLFGAPLLGLALHVIASGLASRIAASAGDAEVLPWWLGAGLLVFALPLTLLGAGVTLPALHRARLTWQVQRGGTFAVGRILEVRRRLRFQRGRVIVDLDPSRGASYDVDYEFDTGQTAVRGTMRALPYLDAVKLMRAPGSKVPIRYLPEQPERSIIDLDTVDEFFAALRQSR